MYFAILLFFCLVIFVMAEKSTSSYVMQVVHVCFGHDISLAFFQLKFVTLYVVSCLILLDDLLKGRSFL